MIHLLPPPKSDEDLFRESTMTFGEHLEELRKCLFRAIIGLAIGFLAGLLLGNHVVKLIQGPLEKALTEHYVTLSQKEVTSRLKTLSEKGLPTAYSAEGAGEFVVSQQMLVDEYLISPQDILVQLPDSFRLVRQQCQDLLKQLANIQEKLRQVNATGDAKSLAEEDRAFLLQVGRQLIAASGSTAPSAHAQGAETARGLNGAEVDAALQILEQDDWQTRVTGENCRVLAKATDLLAASTRQNLERLNDLIRSYDATAASVKGFNSEEVNPEELIHIFAWRPAKDDSRVRAKSLSAHEAFSIYIKASLLVGVLLSAPWVFFQIWLFVAAGLYRHERKFVYTFLPFSLLLFFAGAALAFLYVFEPVLKFLFQFNEWLGIQLEPRISDWLSFVLILPLGFGIGFQLPLVMLFLERIGIFTIRDYFSQWKMAVLVIFVVSAILTPPDPSSQLLMAIPLCLLYFGGIMLCKFFPRSRSGFDTASDSRPV